MRLTEQDLTELLIIVQNKHFRYSEKLTSALTELQTSRQELAEARNGWEAMAACKMQQQARADHLEQQLAASAERSRKLFILAGGIGFRFGLTAVQHMLERPEEPYFLEDGPNDPRND